MSDRAAAIYLDHAATSRPNAPGVNRAVLDTLRTGVSAGRGTYRRAALATAAIDRVRGDLNRLFGGDDARRWVFGRNGTDALNTAIHGLLRPGDHAVASVVEHTSVLRPLAWLRDHAGVTVTLLDCDEAGRLDPAALRAALTPATRLVALTHASNVTGAVQPAAELAALTREQGALFLLDACQTAGHWPLNLHELPVDLLAASGHKGLHGPPGTGVLYVGPRAEPHLTPTRHGGTGTGGGEAMPDALPHRLEPGTPDLPAIAGLGAAVRWVARHGVETLRVRVDRRTRRLLRGLTAIPGVHPLGPPAGADRVGVVSVTLDAVDPHTAAAVLDAEFGVEVRAGLHCAPNLHDRLGTAETGGAVRFSVGPRTTAGEIDAAVAAVREIAAM